MSNLNKEIKRQYQSTNLSTLKRNFSQDDHLRRNTLWNLYNQVCSNWGKLVDIRFKLLGFTPGVSILAIKEISLINDFSLKVILSILGFVATIAIWLYEIRNSQLHDDLISRARKIEEELGIETGQFKGRLKSKNFLIKHDVALFIIYVCSILSWLIFIIYTIKVRVS